jgi:glycine oxidase
MSFDVLIIGGGVIGLSIARELRRAGAGRIAILDRGQPGREASWAAAGMLTPNAECEAVDDLYRFCDASRRMFPTLAQELFEETGVDIELDRSGTLFAAFTEEDAALLEEKFRLQSARGIPVRKLTSAETRELEPAIAAGTHGSLYFPNDWQVDNRKMVLALVRYAELNGIEVFSDTPADALIFESKGRVVGANANGHQVRAAVTVAAAGAWTSTLGLGPRSEVRPVKGQMISYQLGRRVFQRVIYSRRGYLVPRADGRILVGATSEEAGFDRTVTQEAAEALERSANEMAPVLRGLDIADRWAGLRPFISGGRPMIGAVEGCEGLIVATGHYRNGILLAPATGRAVARLIVEGHVDKIAEPFVPRRSMGLKAAV